MRYFAFIASWIALLLCGSQAEERWTYFTIPGLDFVVTIPGKAEAQADSKDAQGIIYRAYASHLPTGSYQVDYTFLPHGLIPDNVTPEQFVGQAVAATAAKDPASKLGSDRRFKFQDASAADFVIDIPAKPLVVKIRLYVRRDQSGNLQAYQSTFAGPPSVGNDADSKRFLDSFKFLPK